MPGLVLGLAGSPRRRGNTSILLDRALAGAADGGARVARIELCQLRVAPCIACGGCFRSGACVVEDGFQSILPQLLEADAVVLASPLYFLGLSGWAKAFIDRCQCLWARRYILHQPLPPTSDGRPRRAAFISTAGTPSVPFSGAIATVKAWLRTLDARYLGQVLRAGVDAAGAISGDAGALEEAYRLGRALTG